MKESESESHSVMFDSLRLHGLYSPWNSPGQNTGMGSLSRLQGIFPTQGSNPGLPHYRRILYQLSHSAVNTQKMYFAKVTAEGALLTDSFLPELFFSKEKLLKYFSVC